MLTELIILSLFFLNHCHSYIAVHFIEMFFITCLLYNCMLILATGYSALRLVVSRRHTVTPLLGLHLLLGYHYDYAIHRSPYTSARVLIENILIQHKMAKNLRMALCCQNRVSKGTNQCYGLHVSALSIVPWLWC